MKKIHTFWLYILFVLLFFVVEMGFWSAFIDGKLYYCSDPIPFLDFIPPFVHSGYGDYYIASSTVVWGIWILMVFPVFLLPYLLVKQLRKQSENV